MNNKTQIGQTIVFSADVGGNAGLFLGASLLTILEMGEFMVIRMLFTLKSITFTGRIKQNPKIRDGDIYKSKYYTNKSFETHQTNSSELDINKNDS